MNEFEFRLSFTIESLKTNVDLIIDKYRNNSTTKINPYHLPKYGALTAYVGETLRRVYQGAWAGEFYCNRPDINYYTSKIIFNNYTFWPSHHIGNALANGRDTSGYGYQTFSEYLEKRVIPQITDKTNLRKASE